MIITPLYSVVVTSPPENSTFMSMLSKSSSYSSWTLSLVMISAYPPSSRSWVAESGSRETSATLTSGVSGIDVTTTAISAPSGTSDDMSSIIISSPNVSVRPERSSNSAVSWAWADSRSKFA